MKVYRVVPDSFATGQRLDTADKVVLEDLYYRMGYVPFSGEIGKHDFNNLQCENKQGKYFYLFAEDAIQEGNALINNYHRLRADTYLVLEYDIPEDIIMKHIGYGDYTSDIVPLFLAETFVEKDDFGTDIIAAAQVSKEKKEEGFVAAFRESLKTMLEYGYSAASDIDYYRNFFWTDLAQLDDETLEKELPKSSLYYAFLRQQCELIPASYITGRVLPANMDFISYGLGSPNEIDAYYQKLGVRCDFSKEQREFKKEFLHTIDPDEPDKEQAKRLLKERRYL